MRFAPIFDLIITTVLARAVFTASPVVEVLSLDDPPPSAPTRALGKLISLTEDPQTNRLRAMDGFRARRETLST
jgi:hypothetical protein